MNQDTQTDFELLTGRAAAARLGVATKTINRWRREGRIQSLQLPDGTYRYCLREIVTALGGMRRAGA